MPLHEYACGRCGRFEVLQKFADPALTVCPACGEAVNRLISAPAIQFKGSGWYVTDYARKSSVASKADAPASASASTKDSSTSSPKSTTSQESSAKGSSPTQ